MRTHTHTYIRTHTQTLLTLCGVAPSHLQTHTAHPHTHTAHTHTQCTMHIHCAHCVALPPHIYRSAAGHRISVGPCGQERDCGLHALLCIIGCVMFTSVCVCVCVCKCVGTHVYGHRKVALLCITSWVHLLNEFRVGQNHTLCPGHMGSAFFTTL